MLSLKQNLESIISAVLTGTPYEALIINIVKPASSFNISVMIDYKARDNKISIDDCVAVSKKIERAVEEKDLFNSKFIINVESPGIDRPLFSIKDYQSSVGFDVKFKLYKAIDSTLSLKAEVLSVKNNIITIYYNKQNHELCLEDIVSAKIIFNDKLVSNLNLFKKNNHVKD